MWGTATTAHPLKLPCCRSTGNCNATFSVLNCTLLLSSYNLCDCLDKPTATPLSQGLPDPHNRKSCEHSPIPSEYLRAPGVAAPGLPGFGLSWAGFLSGGSCANATNHMPTRGVPFSFFLIVLISPPTAVVWPLPSFRQMRELRRHADRGERGAGGAGDPGPALPPRLVVVWRGLERRRLAMGGRTAVHRQRLEPRAQGVRANGELGLDRFLRSPPPPQQRARAV